MSNMSAKQGESTDLFEITIKDLVEYTDYYSDLYVLAADTDATVLGPIRIEAVDNVFPAALSPSQTQGLPAGNYTVVLVVEKSVEGNIEFRKEISWALKINKSLLV